MYNLLRFKIGLIILLALYGPAASAQVFNAKEQYRIEKEYQPFYFGLSLGYASTAFHPTKHPAFLLSDSILVAEPNNAPGYSLRLLATARLSDRWEIRVNPGLILGVDRSFTYHLGSKQLWEEPIVTQKIQSNIATIPLSFKFKSDRIGNFRVYALAGVKYDFDLASNADARNAEEMVKLKKSDYGAELGVGFNFYLPFVTVSPELKFSNGLGNVHARDPQLKYSSVFDRLNSRMMFFTIHLEQ